MPVIKVNLLKRLSTIDEFLDPKHKEWDGGTLYLFLMAEVAREFIAAGNNNDQEYQKEVQRRWEKEKFYKLWKEEELAKRDPLLEFERRGWQI